MRALALCSLLPALALVGCADDDAPPDGLANFRIAPEIADLGRVPVGLVGEGRARVLNTGDRPLSFTVRSSSADVTATLDAPRVEPGQQVGLALRVAPSAEGRQEATVTLSAEGQSSLQRTLTVVYRTDPTTVSCQPQALAFGNVVVGTTSTLVVSCTNNSDVDARGELFEGSNVRRCDGGADTSVFCARLRDRPLGPDGTFEVRAGEAIELEVEFTPVLAGTRERGEVTLRFCGSSACDNEILFDGVGIERGFRCDPGSVDFGRVNPGGCAQGAVTCENLGNRPVQVTDWSLATGASPAFSVDEAAVTALRPGDALEIDARFCPTALGDAQAILRIETDEPAPARPLLVELLGRGGGPDAEVRPEALDFGLAAVGVPTRRSLVVTNVGVDDLEVVQIIVDDAGTGAFRLVSGGGAQVVPPGGALELTVEFVPPAAGRFESGVLIVTNDPDGGDIRVPLVGEGLSVPPCQYTLGSATLDFGEVLVGRSATLGATLRNAGATDCLITSARLEPGADPAFSIEPLPSAPVVLAPGAALTVPVTYRPQAVAAHTARLELSVSDPADPWARVDLSGTGADTASALLSSDRLDFGRVTTGCGTTTRDLRVHNPTAQPLVVSQVGLQNGASSPFAVVVGNLPVTVSPGDNLTLQVGFTPVAAGAFTDVLRLTGTSGGAPRTFAVGLSGEAGAMATQTDTFTQGTAKVDALFVVDFSGGSVDERTRLSSEFTNFIRAADASGLDYQVGITSTDANDEAGRLVHPMAANAGSFSGPFSNRVITRNSTPSPAAVFEANLLARFATGGASVDEAGLWSAYLALTPPVLTGHNAGFLRPDADLMLVFLADEPDGTLQAAVGAPSTQIDFYLDYFRALKGPGTRFRASAIAGDVPGGCSGPGGAAAATPAYVALTQRTGGTFASVCSTDYGRIIDDIGQTSFGPSRTFDLTQPADASSVTVRVDGVVISRTGNWQLDLANGRVAFAPFAIPAAGSTVEVEYTVACQ